MGTPSEEIVAQMRAALSVTEPALDTGIGTTVRKVLDVVGESIAEVYVDNFFLDRQYDLESKSGAALDDFVTLFGFQRLPARRATGSITFERTGSTDQSVFITQGTRVATNSVPPVLFSTTIPAVLGVGETTIEVPIIAVEGGSKGNVAVGAITRPITALQGITGIANFAGTISGTDAETDERLRARFRQTLFRNLAGTEAMFEGVALEDSRVVHVNALGIAKRHSERLELVGGTATSLIQDAKFVYPKSDFFGSDLAVGEVAISGVHYLFNPVVPPEVTSLDAGEVPDGIYDLEFEYISTTSRNDSSNNEFNKVDLYVDGQRVQEATEQTLFSDTALFTDTVSDELYRQNFRRHADWSVPAAGNHFVRFAFSPTIAVPDTLDVGGETYTEGEDYWAVNDITAEGLGWGSLSGIEFLSVANGQAQPLPADGTVMTVIHNFNSVPRDVQQDIESWRILHTDVMVHAAKIIRLDMFMAAILDPGYSQSGVEQSAFVDVAEFLTDIGFQNTVQVSDLLAVVHAVEGIDAVRFLTSDDDASDYAIKRIAPDGSTVLETYDDGGTPARAIDIVTGDDELLALNNLTILPRAANTFGTV